MPNVARLLIVEDDLDSQILLQLALQKAGYTVQVASTAQAALALYPFYDLLLMDVLLPDMDGFSLCVELRLHSEVPIVMLTALNRSEDIVHGFAVGVEEYITKPYRTRELIARLQAVLRRSTYRGRDTI